MIKITIVRDQAPERGITAFKVDGHADYAAHGEDIVCAGVSAVTFGTVNAIEALTGCKLDITMQDSGFIEAKLPRIQTGHTHEQVRLLLESMVVMLDTIKQSYGDYVTIDTITQGKS